MEKKKKKKSKAHNSPKSCAYIFWLLKWKLNYGGGYIEAKALWILAA